MININKNIPNYYSIQMVWEIWLAPVYSYYKHCGMCAVTQWKVEKILEAEGISVDVNYFPKLNQYFNI